MSELTEEQKRRIEENRKKALAKLAASKAKANLAQGNSSSLVPNSGAGVSNLQRTANNGTSQYVSNFSKPWSASLGHPGKAGTSNSCLPSSSMGALSSFTNNADKVSQSAGLIGCVNTVEQPKPSSNSAISASGSIGALWSFSNGSPNKASSFSESSASPVKFVRATFVLLSRTRFFVDAKYHAQMIEIFKSIPNRVYDMKTKRWNFAIEDHDKLVEELKVLRPHVEIYHLPKNIVKLFMKNSIQGSIKDQDLSSLDPVLLNTLMPFQKEGVNFGISLNGRVLIADDMGLGKTIQAIAIASYYKADWPLLVVTPSSVKYSWAEEFNKWLPSYSGEVIVINSGKDHIPKSKIVLMSYDMLSKKKEDILQRGFRSVIMDESHFLKSPKAARTKAAQQIMKHMRRIIMLSGTPALSRPAELFPQISALNPILFPNFMEFGMRYCDGKRSNWGWDFVGSSNMEELNIVLRETLMIRRLKSEVMKQLPPKIRQVIVLDTAKVAAKNKVLVAISKKMALLKANTAEHRGMLLQFYHETGVTKVPFICEYLKDLLEADQKFLCFAHHQVVLDGITDLVESMNIKYIRIQGSTPSDQRKVLCDKFQMNDSYKVAILSITAANTGITLTSANLVVFAELFWNPGVLTQAEDRAHRIGQEDTVVVQYLVARSTADDQIWPLVQKKLDTLNKAGLSKDTFAQSETIEPSRSMQPCIGDFWNELDIGIEPEDDYETYDCGSKRQRKT